MLAIGLPIVIFFSFVISFTEDHTVVSVGPYILYILAFVKTFNSANNFSGKGSPPKRIYFKFFTYSKLFLSLNSKENLDGVVCNILTLFFRHNV